MAEDWRAIPHAELDATNDKWLMCFRPHAPPCECEECERAVTDYEARYSEEIARQMKARGMDGSEKFLQDLFLPKEGKENAR